jgi:hypothetical protein
MPGSNRDGRGNRLKGVLTRLMPASSPKQRKRVLITATESDSAKGGKDTPPPPSQSNSPDYDGAASPSGAHSGSVSYGAAPDGFLPSPSQSNYDGAASPSTRHRGSISSDGTEPYAFMQSLTRSNSIGVVRPGISAPSGGLRVHMQTILHSQLSILQNFCHDNNSVKDGEELEHFLDSNSVEDGEEWEHFLDSNSVEDGEEWEHFLDSVNAVSKAANRNGGEIYVNHLKSVVDKFYKSITLQWQNHENMLKNCIAAIVSCENGRKWCEGRLQYELFRVNNFSPNQVGILALITHGLYDYYHNDPTGLPSEKWVNLLNGVIARISKGVRIGILLSNEPSPISGIISDEPSPRGGIISLIQCTENGTDHLIYLLEIILNTEPKLAYNRQEKSTLERNAYILRQLLMVTELITNELHKYNNAVINDKLHKLVANKATKVANLIRGYCAAHEEHHYPDECNYSSVSGGTGTFDLTKVPSHLVTRYHSSSIFDPRDIHDPTLVPPWEPQRSGEHTQGHFSPPVEGSFESHHTGGAGRDYAAAQPNRSRPPSTPSSGYHSPTHELPPRLNTNFTPPSYDPRSAPPLPDTPPSDGDPPKTKRKKSSSRLHSGHAPAASELGAPQALAVCAAAEEQDLRASVAEQIAAHKAKGAQEDKSKRGKFVRSLSLSNLPDVTQAPSFTPSLQNGPGSPGAQLLKRVPFDLDFVSGGQTNLANGTLIPLTSSKAQITHASSMPTTPRAGHKSANALQWTHSDPAERSITN